MKKKGFTLIEVIVVVALIMLLAITLLPKLMNEMAKARDAKAVAALGSTRTAVTLFITNRNKMPILYGSSSGDSIIYTNNSDYLENQVVNFIKHNTPDSSYTDSFIVPIGGRSASNGVVEYGGYIEIGLDATDKGFSKFKTILDTDKAVDTGNISDTKGNTWASY